MKRFLLALVASTLIIGCGGRGKRNLGLVDFTVSNNLQASNLEIEVYSISNGFNLNLVGKGSLEDGFIDFFKPSNDQVLIKVVEGSYSDPVTDTNLSFDSENYFSAVYYLNEIKDGGTQLNINFLTSLQTVLIYEKSKSQSLNNAISYVRSETNDLFNFDIIHDEVGSLDVNAGNLSNDDLYAFALAAVSSFCSKISISNQLSPGQTFNPINLISILKNDYKDSILDNKNGNEQLEFRDYVLEKSFRNEIIDGILHVSLDESLNNTNLSPVDLLDWIRRIENRDNSIFSHSSNTYFNQNIFFENHTVLQPAENEYFSEWVNIQVLSELDQKVLSWVESSKYPVQIEYTSSGIYDGDFYSNILSDGEYKVYTATIASNGQFQVNERIFNIYNQDPIVNLSIDYDLNDSIDSAPFFNGISLTGSFFLKYNIESLLDLNLVDININGVDLNTNNSVLKNSAKFIDIYQLGEDGFYEISFTVVDTAGNVTFLQNTIRKNIDIYEQETASTYPSSGVILKSQVKSYEIGDINNDGYSDAFVHISTNPKIFLGPEFTQVWDISDDDWYSSAHRCDVDGDGISDIVVGNSESTLEGKIKVFFGPMLNDKEFSNSYEYIGTADPFANIPYYERAGAVLGCARLSGGNKDQILHFNANQNNSFDLVNIPSELEILNFNTINNSLDFISSSFFGSFSVEYPLGIMGDKHTSFSTSGDIDNDNFEDIILNGWFNPSNGGYSVKQVSALHGGPSNDYFIGPTQYLRQKYTDINDIHSVENAFSDHFVSIIDDGNNDGFDEVFYVNASCFYSNTCSSSVPISREYDAITNQGSIVYSDDYSITNGLVVYDARAFDYDGDGTNEIFFMHRGAVNDSSIAIKSFNQNLTYIYSRHNYYTPNTIWGSFTPIILDSYQKAILIIELFESGLYNLRVLRDVY